MRWGLLFALLALAGCGVRQTVVRPILPAASALNTAGKPMVIDVVTDARPPAALPMDADTRSRNVGAQGHAGSGFELQLADASVVDTMRQLVGIVFGNAGYRVATDAPDATHVTVTITRFDVAAPFQFWRSVAWSPKMLAHVDAVVQTQSPSGRATYNVQGYGSNVFQRMSADNWEVALNRAIDDFARKLHAQLQSGSATASQ